MTDTNNQCSHDAWENLLGGGAKCADCGTFLENPPKRRIQPGATGHAFHMQACGPHNGGACKYGQDDICPAVAAPAAPGQTTLVDIANPWNLSAHRRDLMTLAAETLLLEQAIVGTVHFDRHTTRLAFNRVTSLVSNLVFLLQKEAIARELGKGDA
jgi:hypothetical protein